MADTQLWRSVIKQLETKIKKADLLVWFQGTAILAHENGKVVIGLPSIFSEEWFSKRYKGILHDAFNEIGEKIDSIEFQIDSSLIDEGGAGMDMREFASDDTKRKVRKLPKRQEFKVVGSDLTSKMMNPKYSLDNFVVGNDNRLAHAAASAVVRKPGTAYNPLFVYGDVGLGKTHLLQAIGNGIQLATDKLVIYCTAEKFTNEIVEAIKKNDVNGFRNRYRRADVLIIDDIQFLAKKKRTQEEFFHTFNDMYHDNKQVVLSSDRPPKELDGIEERLVSRFEMGMIVDVGFPDYETRLAIMHRKCQEMEALIPTDVLEFIAYNARASIRELEGILVQAIAQAKLENSTPTVNSVAKIMKKLGMVEVNKPSASIERDSRPLITNCNDVINIVSGYYKVEMNELTGDRRSRDIMVPRQVCMYLLRNEFNFSFEKIGDEFGGRNHTTAMHAYNKMVKALKNDSKLVRDVNAIKKEMGM